MTEFPAGRGAPNGPHFQLVGGPETLGSKAKTSCVLKRGTPPPRHAPCVRRVLYLPVGPDSSFPAIVKVKGEMVRPAYGC